MAMSDAEAACVYAALILQDEGLEITVEMLEKVINAAGLTIPNIYPKIFAKALQGKDIKEFLFNVATAPPATADADAAANGETADKENEKNKEEEEEEEEESDDGDLFDLFG